MSVKLLTEHHLELLCLKGGCIGSSESTLVKSPHCWKSRAVAQIWIFLSCSTIHSTFRCFNKVAEVPEYTEMQYCMMMSL